MKFKILSYYKIVVSIEHYGFLGLKIKSNFKMKIIRETDSEFNKIDIIKQSKLTANRIIVGDFHIHSILRICDNKILTVDDKTYVYNGLPEEIELISEFKLDGEEYCGHILKSKSGIQVFFGGGTFVDIEDFNKTPLKELRKIKLEKLKRTCNGGVS